MARFVFGVTRIDDVFLDRNWVSKSLCALFHLKKFWHLTAYPETAVITCKKCRFSWTNPHFRSKTGETYSYWFGATGTEALTMARKLPI